MCPVPNAGGGESASAEASVLQPDCPCYLGQGEPASYTSSGACLLPFLLKEAPGLVVAVTVSLSRSCGREPLPQMGSGTRTKRPG